MHEVADKGQSIVFRIMSCAAQLLIAPGLCLSLIVGQGGQAHAQTASSANDPGQIERRIRDRALPAPPREAVITPVQTPAVATEAVEPLSVALTGIVVEGATAFPTATFVSTYQEYLGRVVSSRDIETILARITRLYRDRGFFLSTAIAPPQDLLGGLVRVRVIEGYVERVAFKNAGGRADALRPHLDPVLAERPLTLATLERGVLLINDLPGIGAAAQMEVIDASRGTYELVLDVEDTAADGAFFFNNWGTDAVGPLQLWLSGGVNAGVGRGGRLQGGVFTVPNQPAELLYGELAYVHPLDRNGTFVSAGGALARINEGDGSAIDSTSQRATVRVWHPAIRQQDQNLWLSTTFDYYNLDQRTKGDSLVEDRLRVLRAGFNYWQADPGGGSTFLVGELSQGLPILGASRSNATNLTTYKGRSDFTKLTVSASREQGLTRAIGIQVTAKAQKSLTRLLSAEQFGYGGSQFGPAYDFSELVGDDGVAAGLELRFGRELDGWGLKAYQLFTGCDVGLVWNDAEGSRSVRDSLASIGGGIRLTLADGVLGTLQVARGLPAFDSTSGDDVSRMSFTLSVNW